MQEIAYNKHMTEENRTVAEYINAKLGMTAKKYCDIQKMPYRTLAERWLHDKGRTHIINQVFKMYAEIKTPASVKRFNDL